MVGQTLSPEMRFPGPPPPASARVSHLDGLDAWRPSASRGARVVKGQVSV